MKQEKIEDILDKIGDKISSSFSGLFSDSDEAADDIHRRGLSNAGIAETVWNQLKDDYDEDLMHWIRSAHWKYYDRIPLDIMDSSNKEEWFAYKNKSKVDEMVSKMKNGWEKPIVLVNEPNDSRLKIIDGHHRFLAAHKSKDKYISGFVGFVGSVGGQWDEMHRLQRQGEEGGAGSNQKSNQSNQDMSDQK